MYHMLVVHDFLAKKLSFIPPILKHGAVVFGQRRSLETFTLTQYTSKSITNIKSSGTSWLPKTLQHVR